MSIGFFGLNSIVTPQPTLPPRFYSLGTSNYQLDSGTYNIGYFGNFYATRGLNEVLDALAMMDPSQRARVTLHVFTSSTSELKAGVAAKGLADRVRVSDYVPYLEFLHLTTIFDCLLVNDASSGETHAINPYLPSKLSDYEGSGTDIWAITEVGSTLSQLHTRFSSTLGDVAGAKDVLEQMAHTR